MADGLNAGVMPGSQQTNFIHYGKPWDRQARLDRPNAVSARPWEVGPNCRLRNKFYPNVPSDISPQWAMVRNMSCWGAAAKGGPRSLDLRSTFRTKLPIRYNLVALQNRRNPAGGLESATI